MNACVFCGQSNGHDAACPTLHRASKADMKSWQAGYKAASDKIFAMIWIRKHFTATFQLGYTMGSVASHEAVVASS